VDEFLEIVLAFSQWRSNTARGNSRLYRYLAESLQSEANGRTLNAALDCWLSLFKGTVCQYLS
ncbi:hypothetical protein, partial [Corynebacterium jeikeium]